MEQKRQTATIRMRLRVENNSKFVRGKGKVREWIEYYLAFHYQMEPISGEYVFYVAYVTIDDVEKTLDEILHDMAFEADLRNCFIEVDAYCDELGLTW